MLSKPQFHAKAVGHSLRIIVKKPIRAEIRLNRVGQKDYDRTLLGTWASFNIYSRSFFIDNRSLDSCLVQFTHNDLRSMLVLTRKASVYMILGKKLIHIVPS